VRRRGELGAYKKEVVRADGVENELRSSEDLMGTNEGACIVIVVVDVRRVAGSVKGAAESKRRGQIKRLRATSSADPVRRKTVIRNVTSGWSVVSSRRSTTPIV
jgi:hypothetical protein